MAIPVAVGVIAVSSALDILGGIMGRNAAEENADRARQLAQMIRREAEFDIKRYMADTSRFKAQQGVAYTKAGVQLSGSPLEVLDETTRISEENIAAMRRRAEMQALDYERQAESSEAQGRASFVSGIAGGIGQVTRLLPWGSKGSNG